MTEQLKLTVDTFTVLEEDIVKQKSCLFLGFCEHVEKLSM